MVPIRPKQKLSANPLGQQIIEPEPRHQDLPGGERIAIHTGLQTAIGVQQFWATSSVFFIRLQRLDEFIYSSFPHLRVRVEEEKHARTCLTESYVIGPAETDILYIFYQPQARFFKQPFRPRRPQPFDASIRR